MGLIGAGLIAERQAAGFRAHGRLAQLVAVADLDGERAERARRAFGFKAAHSDPLELLGRDDVDVVSICTRPDSHGRLVEEAVRAGKHVLCEKPITRTLAEADALIALCEAHPEVRVSALYQWRADPAFALQRRLLEEGELGRPLLGDAHLRTQRAPGYYDATSRRESFAVDGGGVVMGIGIHQVDLLLTLLGEAVEVAARMGWFHTRTEGEDTLVGWVRFASGAFATVRCTSCEHQDRFALQILGEKAAMHVAGGGSRVLTRWEIHATDRSRRRRLRARGRREAPWRPDPGRQGVRIVRRLYRALGRTWWPPGSWWHGPFVGRYLEAVRDGTPVPVPPREARRSIELVTALYQSALTGGTVSLPLGETSPFYAGVDPAHTGARLEATP